jgi:hypothetical protein
MELEAKAAGGSFVLQVPNYLGPDALRLMPWQELDAGQFDTVGVPDDAEASHWEFGNFYDVGGRTGDLFTDLPCSPFNVPSAEPLLVHIRRPPALILGRLDDDIRKEPNIS